MSNDDEQMWQPVRPSDVADDHPSMVAGHLRALQREMRDGFQSIAMALKAFERIDGKLDVVIERQNYQDKRLDALEFRIATLESQGRKPRKK
jgi:hypothetical protein